MYQTSIYIQVRSRVQQDMMRPKSAMFYIGTIEQISNQLADKIEKSLDSKREIGDLTKIVYFWALEAISAIFLDTRLGCLKEQPSKDCTDLIAASEVVLGKEMMKLISTPPIWR